MTEQQLRILSLESNTALGDYGEQIAATLLRRLGYKVRIHRHAGYDLTATNRLTGQVFKIEVKTARKHSDNKWRFTAIKNGHTHSKHSDIIICLQFEYGCFTPYIIPVSDVANKPSICITSSAVKYAGKYRQYQSNWSILQ